MIGVADYQKALSELGYDVGPVDGIRGRRTINAVKRFQKHSRLEVDGIVGPKTAAKLFGKKSIHVTQPIDTMPWMDEAARIMGWHEKIDNKRLFEWLRSDGRSVGDPAKIPWCGDFVQTSLAKSMPDEVLPKNPYWARSWAKFGVPCKIVTGAIASFTRGKGGHVGFVVKYDPARHRILLRGGNQSNRVSDSWISADRLIATRWPATALPPQGITIASGAGQTLSTNEA